MYYIYGTLFLSSMSGIPFIFTNAHYTILYAIILPLYTLMIIMNDMNDMNDI